MVNIEKIHLVQILTIKGNISAPEKFELSPTDAYNFQYSVVSNSNPKENMMSVEITMDIDGLKEDGSANDLKASYTNRFVFIVDNFQDYLVKSIDGMNYFDKEIGMTLVGVAYSTMRGIIHTRTQGTPLSGVIIPVVDVSKLIEDDTIDEDQLPKSEQPI